MTGEYNPYQAPLESTIEDAVAKPKPAQVISERFEFEGELTRQHYRNAIRYTKFRIDVWNGQRTLLTLWGIIFTVAVWWLVYRTNSFMDQTRIGTLIVVVTFSLGSVILRNRWVIASLIPDNQLNLGKVKGWFDGQTLFMESDGFTSYSNMDALFSSAYNDELMLLNFGSESVLWTVIPFDFFPDPMAARTVAEDLSQIYPPRPPVAPDERKREPPTDAFRFDRSPNAIGFEGPLKHDSVKGSRFEKHSKQITRGTLGIFAFSGLSLALALCFVFGFNSFGAFAVLCWFTLMAASIVLRRWRASRRMQEDSGNIAWRSRGWFDDNGYFSMTTTGQASLSWHAIDHHEITEQLISLYPRAGDVCACLVSRDQFGDDSDWQKACELIREKVPVMQAA